jgi:hypothetical protein
MGRALPPTRAPGNARTCNERHVTRTFTITLVNGNATIVINGARYVGNVSTGALNAG